MIAQVALSIGGIALAAIAMPSSSVAQARGFELHTFHCLNGCSFSLDRRRVAHTRPEAS